MFIRSLEAVLAGIDPKPAIRVVWPTGEGRTFGDGPIAATVRFRTAGAVSDLAIRSQLGFGEAFVRGDIEIEGDLQAVIGLGFALHEQGRRGGRLARLVYAAGFRGRRNTPANARRNIAAHYDLDNEFYRLWLDAEMQYTCAYFANPNETLESAQRRKMDLVCRKLALQPGQLVVEAGGGWGGLALHMVRHWGVRVVSFNISAEQVAFARARADILGIPRSSLDYVQDDYRNVRRHVSQCDRFVSICMLEHVGRENYPALIRLMADVLRPKGLALLQFLSRTRPSATPNPWLERHVFPGYYNPSIGELMAAVERDPGGLQLIDLENIRFHYALTVRHWLERLEANAETIRARWGEAVLRTFRLYLNGGIADFTRGHGTLVHQAVFTNGPDNLAPLDRMERLAMDARHVPPPQARRAERV